MDKLGRVWRDGDRVYRYPCWRTVDGYDMNDEYFSNVQDGLAMVDFNSEHVLDDLNQVVPSAIVSLHNNMIKALRSAYPKWADYWHITIDTRGGIVQVRNMKLSGDWGFVLHIEKIDPEMRRVREMAGELLTRFNVSTNKGIPIQQAMADVKTDLVGRIKHES